MAGEARLIMAQGQGQPAINQPPMPAKPESSTEAVSQRDSKRMPAREYYRSMARRDPIPTAEFKYHIAKADYVPDCDHVWVPIRINGMDSGQLRLYLSNGWVPARACDFEKLSGFGQHIPGAIERSGYVPNVQADDPVERDGQMLFVRPEELSVRSDDERLRDARLQVDTQMRRLEMASRRSLGSKAEDLMKVQYGRQYANPDQFKDIASERDV
jgi:hypothetical protein